MTTTALLTVIETVYAAAEEPSRWSEVLDTAARAAGCEAAGLYVQDVRHGTASIAAATNFSDSFLRSYEQHYAAQNCWTTDPTKFTAGDIQVTDDLLPISDLLKSEYYSDWLRPQGLFRGVNICISKEASLLANLTVLRAKRRGEFKRKELQFLGALTPHLERAVRLNRIYAANAARVRSLTEVVDRIAFGVILLDKTGRVVFANREAERILALNDGLSLRDNRLTGENGGCSSELQSAIAAALSLSSVVGCGSGALRCLRRSGGLPFELLITPIRTADQSVAESPVVGVFISDTEQRPVHDQEVWRSLYGLTKTEACFAERLVAGERLEDVAESLSISINTSKTHMGNIFQKTGTHRQAELVGRLSATISAIKAR